MDGFGLVFGLGLVLSFGYWSTDFVQLQRALAVRREREAPFIPLGVGFAKLAFALLTALTGVAAPLVISHAELSRNWNAALPALMLHFYAPVWLVFGMMGLAASLVSTFSNNVAGFTSACIQGIYQKQILPAASDKHYIWMSRMTNAGVVLLSVGTAYLALGFQSLMEYIQLILSTFNAPLFALVTLAVAAPKRAASGGRAGFLLGLGCAGVHQVLALTHVLRYGSQMAANFYGAILGFSVGLIGTLTIGTIRRVTMSEAEGQESRDQQPTPIPRSAWAAGIVLVALFIVFNVVFW
jgi:solute:Na+ symporter, SSS family